MRMRGCTNYRGIESKDGNVAVTTHKLNSTKSTERVVKIAAMQTAISYEVPYFLDDRVIFFQKIEGMIDVAAKNGANILAFPELFCKYLPGVPDLAYPYSHLW